MGRPGISKELIERIRVLNADGLTDPAIAERIISE